MTMGGGGRAHGQLPSHVYSDSGGIWSDACRILVHSYLEPACGQWLTDDGDVEKIAELGVQRHEGELHGCTRCELRVHNEDAIVRIMVIYVTILEQCTSLWSWGFHLLFIRHLSQERRRSGIDAHG